MYDSVDPNSQSGHDGKAGAYRARGRNRGDTAPERRRGASPDDGDSANRRHGAAYPQCLRRGGYRRQAGRIADGTDPDELSWVQPVGESA